MTPYPTLLSPWRVGPVALRNRVVSTSHQTGLVHDHLPTADLVAYHEARAAGGAAVIVLEATAVDPSGLLTPHTIGGFRPEVVAAYTELAGALHERGAKLFVQLFHGGREQIAAPPRAPAVAPSAVPSARFHAEPRALTLSEIAELLEGYRSAASLAREGGVDGLEVSASHGYLPAQFFARSTNQREDRYGGALDARVRFAAEAIAAVRDGAGPSLAVGVRLSADEMDPAGLDAEGCAAIAATLQAAVPLDFVSVVLGSSSSYAGSTWIVPPPPLSSASLDGPLAQMRAVLDDVTLVATSGVVEPARAESLLAGGHADLVGMTRAQIADPGLVTKLAAGRERAVNWCIGCNQGCIGHYHAGTPISCVVNPRAGRERTFGRPATPTAPPGAPRTPGRPRVIVVGAGPAGMAAAVEAAAAGAAVTLIEASQTLGGQFALAGSAPAHREAWERWSVSLRTRLAEGRVEVRLGELVTPTGAEALLADLGGARGGLLLATGARPFVPPGLEREVSLGDTRAVVVDAWEAIARPERVQGPVVVADWGGGWTGLDVAEVLAAGGRTVTLACAAAAVGEGVHQYQRNLYLARLDRLGVRLVQHCELALDDGRAWFRHVFSGRVLETPEAATLVISLGRAPSDALWPALAGRPNVERIGDVLGPRSAEEAVLEGALAGARLAG